MEDLNSSAINYTPINVADYQTSLPPVEPKKKRFNYLNLALLFLTCTSLLGLAFAIRTSQTTINTSATYNTKKGTTMVMEGVELGDYKFPRSFKNITIPASIYQSAKVKDEAGKTDVNDYIKEQVIKFYVYKNILDENAIESTVSTDVSDYTTLKENVAYMELLVREKLVTAYDFTYILARFSPDLPESKTKADTQIQIFKTKLQDAENPATVADEANNDPELVAINGEHKSGYIERYDQAVPLFPMDINFHTFLMSQQENIVSPIYTTSDPSGVLIANLILKIQKIGQKKYTSLDQIINEQQSNFSY